MTTKNMKIEILNNWKKDVLDYANKHNMCIDNDLEILKNKCYDENVTDIDTLLSLIIPKVEIHNDVAFEMSIVSYCLSLIDIKQNS